MIPIPHLSFDLHIDTNEMIERGRLAALLEAIENEVRNRGFAGPHAVLLVGAIHHGSVELRLGVAGVAVGGLSALMAVPAFLISLKDMTRDPSPQPNAVAATIAEVMSGDGAQKVEFRYGDKVVTIKRDDVPYYKRIKSDMPGYEAASLMDHDRFADHDDDDDRSHVDDEDQDWLPDLRASDHPPREVAEAPVGQIAALRLVGEFERIERKNGNVEWRFVPRDRTLSQYFIVTSHAYDPEPMEMAEYEVIGNITLDGDGPGRIEVLSIMPPGDALLTLRR
ncbi:hypothetical protein [Sphingomonas sp. GC_Shp_3]|uniref:hypothetical protein n=1 Tax=Sphingomonas sp. GC_Shp_3 TaxID=2937383 RepID=UPI00226A7CF1|nr:hypothetical protein [Sphingomonas sp. GC_Shp_3]